MVIKISKGYGKMDHINSINTNPLTNDFCMKMSLNSHSVCSKCYSLRSCKRWKSMQIPLDKNGIELSECILPMSDLPYINALIFRFSSHGELINYRHLINLLKICRKNPKVVFALWSKRLDLIKRMVNKPKNLIIVYSSPIINKVSENILNDNKNIDKVFTVFSKDYAKKHSITINCEKKCFKCQKCYNLNDKTEYIAEIIK